MLTEMDHPFGRGEEVYDVTFENVQAGLRTDYLFRLANQRGGIVLGTGDLSELALGWSTYGVGDQMSHYNVNGGVPKTLIQHLIRWVISSGQFDDRVDAVLQSVLDTEISPELVPTGEDEEIQSSEDKIGPYVLQDFSLFRCCGTGSDRPRWRSWPGTLGTTPRPDTGRWATRGTSGRHTRSRRFGTGYRCSCNGFTRSASSSAPRCPTDPRCRPAVRSHRAATGAPPRTCRPGSGWTRSSGRCPRPEGGCTRLSRLVDRWQLSSAGIAEVRCERQKHVVDDLEDGLRRCRRHRHEKFVPQQVRR